MGCFAGIVYPHALGMGKVVDAMVSTMAHQDCGAGQSAIFHNLEIGCCNCSHFCDPTHDVVAVMDGELFNKASLISTLKAQGFHFTTGKTGEVLVRAYQHYGEEIFRHLDGEFIVCIADIQAERIYLARDPLGKKPLYWAHQQDHLFFASELKGLLSTGRIPPTPSPEALATHLFFGYTPQDLTLIEGVNKLLPGYFLEYRGDTSLSIQPYWSFSSFFGKGNHIPHREAAEHFSTLIRKAVEKRLPDPADQTGCFVSGGMGSASIAYYVNEKTERPPHAYTTIFAGQNDQDLVTATTVAETLGLPHRSMAITPSSLVDNLPTILWYLDEPLADPNAVAAWHLARIASAETATVFSGMGSDELLTGHARYTIPEVKTKPQERTLLATLRNFFLPLISKIDPRDAFSLTRKFQTNPWQYEYLQKNALFPLPILKKASPQIAPLFDPRVFLNRFYQMSHLPTPLSTFVYFDVKTRLVDWYMLEYERMTSAHGLQWQTPFLDRSIVEFLVSLPSPETFEEKDAAKLLRTLFKEVYPPSVTARPKRARPKLLRSWAAIEPLRDIFPLLDRGILVDTGIVSGQWLREVTSSPQKMEQAFPYLWAFLTLEIWFRLYIHETPETTIPTMTTRELLLR